MGKKVFKDVKVLKLDVSFRGVGAVNNDGGHQKFALREAGLIKGQVNDNVVFSKKNIYMDEEGKYYFKAKVSSECIRHDMFIEEAEFHNTEGALIDEILYGIIAQPAMIERGYMEATSFRALKKRSPVSISDAEGISRHYTVMTDLCTRSGKKESSSAEGETAEEALGKRGGTNLYYKESIGEEVYLSTGFIDLTEMQFISADDNYDRNAICADEGSTQERIYLDNIKKNFGPDHRFGFYYMKQGLTKDEWAERGILLNKEAVDFMTKDVIRRIMQVSIRRRGSHFVFNSIRITVNTLDNPEGEVIEIQNLEDIYNYQFEYFEKYLEADEELIKKNRDLCEKNKKDEADRRAEKKAAKKSAKDKK